MPENAGREAQEHMPDSDKPLTPGQRDERRGIACRDLGNVDCGYESAGESIDEVRDSMMRHYIDAHPGHKIDDAELLALSERYRM